MNYSFSKECRSTFEEYVARRRKLPFFSNARSIRNALDRSRLRQANRLFSRMGGKITRQELMTIEAVDIKISRVFQGEVDNDKNSELIN